VKECSWKKKKTQNQNYWRERVCPQWASFFFFYFR